MIVIRGLGKFCEKNQINIPQGENFNLLDFLLDVSRQAFKLASYEGEMNEVKRRLGKESDQWGGCPRCGTDVYVGLSKCPLCDLNLMSDEDDIETPLEIATEKISDLNSNMITDKLSEGIDNDTEFDDEILPEEENDIDIEAEILAETKKAVEQKKIVLKEKKQKVNPRRNLLPYSEKAKIREKRKIKLEQMLPKFEDNPDLLHRLKYRDVLVLPGLLGYDKKPTNIGTKEEIIFWVKQQFEREPLS